MDGFTRDNAIFGATSPETAVVVDDYPYGFRLRTKIRYWIETKTPFGDRLVSQTLNPKTGQWNRPKSSTYAPVGVMYRHPDTGYITWAGLKAWATTAEIAAFRAATDGNLNSQQLAQLAQVIAMNKIDKAIDWKVTDVTSETPADRAARQAEQTRDMARLNAAIAAETRATYNDLKEGDNG